MILRLWRGWADGDRAPAYEQLLLGHIAPAILDRGIPGLRDLTVLRRDPGELAPGAAQEFLTAMTFDDTDAVRAFTGGDQSSSVVPAAARELLTRFEDRSQHYVSLAGFPSRR